MAGGHAGILVQDRRPVVARDLVIVCAATLGAALVAAAIDFERAIGSHLEPFERGLVDEAILVLLVLASSLAWFCWRRWHELAAEVAARKQAEAEREELIVQLEEALANVKTLRGLVPICAWCKKIRDDRGFWEGVETFVEQHSDARFTHGICPACEARVAAEVEDHRADVPARTS